MNVFQASSGYRTPAKSMTVKALEARLKAAQEERAQSAVLDQTISNPWQGAAYLTNVLAGQANEYRAESADIQARDQLAKIKAGIDWSKGPSSEQYAEFSRLDPEGADKVMQDWVDYRQDMEKQAKQNEYNTSERLGTQGFQTAQQEDQQKSAAELAVAEDARTVEENKRKEGLPQTGSAKINQDYNNGLYGPVGSEEAIKLRDAELAKENTVTAGFGGPAGMKAVNDMNAQVGQYDSALSNFNRALELTDQIPDELMGDAQLMISKVLNSAGPLGVEGAMALLKSNSLTAPLVKNITPQQVQALLEYDRLVGLNAMTTMSQTLKGQSTDREMAAFLQRLAAGGMSREERKRVISNLKGAIIKDRDFTAAQLTSQGYKTDPYTDPTPAPATTTTPAATTTAPPADYSTLSDEELAAKIAEEQRRARGQ